MALLRGRFFGVKEMEKEYCKWYNLRHSESDESELWLFIKKDDGTK